MIRQIGHLILTLGISGICLLLTPVEAAIARMWIEAKAVISQSDMRHPPQNSIIRRKLFDFWSVRVLSFFFMFRPSPLSSIAEANYYDSA